LITFNGDLYFASDQDTNAGRELYRYDGSTVQLVANLTTQNGSDSSPSDFAVLGDTLYFAADSDTIGRELFSFDSTNGVASFDLRSGSSDSNPQGLTVAGSDLFFQAKSDSGGNANRELYRVNTSGPQLFEIVQGGSGSSPTDFAALGNDIYFAADSNGDRELWRVLSGSAFAEPVANISPLGSSSPTGLFNNNGTLVFAADDGMTGNEPWRLVPSDAGLFSWQLTGTPVTNVTGAGTTNRATLRTTSQ
jgi:ELWxxDGT repeat protein